MVAVATRVSGSREVQGGTTANPEIDKQAMAILERWVKGRAQTQRFSVTVAIGDDVVQD
jgi:hypothetical protein